MSPFNGTPRGDLILDALAAVVLIISLTLLWGPDGMGNPQVAATRVDVLLVTLVSLLSLTLPYLAGVGVLPATWTVITRRNARLLANVPYAILVLVHYAISLTDSSHFLGAAVPIGLAGAALAAQPRIAELGPVQLDSAISAVWLRIFAGLAGLVVLTSVVGFALSVGGSLEYFAVMYLLQLVALAALVVAPIMVGAVGLWRRSGEWAVALGVFGAALGVAILFGGGGYYAAGAVMIGLVFIPAVGAIAASAVVRRVMPGTNGHGLWLGAAIRVLELVMVTAGIYAALQVPSMIAWMNGVTAARLIANVLIVVAAAVARSALKGNPIAARPLVLGVAGGVALGGLVVWIVVSRSEYDSLMAVETAVYFLLPAAVVALVTAPASVRAFFPARVPSAPAPAWASAPVAPQQPVAGQAAVATAVAPLAWPTPGVSWPTPGVSWPRPGDAGSAPAPWPAQPTSTAPDGVAAPWTSAADGSATAWSAPMPAAVGTVPPSRRLLAFVLDGVAGSLLLFVAYLVSVALFSGGMLAGSDSAITAGFMALIFIPALASLAFAIAQLVWEGKQGLTVGNKLMGIQTVTFGSDVPPGIGRAFIRRFIEGLGSLVVVGGPVVAASAAWDEPARRQGWQDKIAGTEMVLLQGAPGTTGTAVSPVAATAPAVIWAPPPAPAARVPAPPAPPVPPPPAPPAPPVGDGV